MTTAARPTFFPAVGGEEQGYYVMKQGTRSALIPPPLTLEARTHANFLVWGAGPGCPWFVARGDPDVGPRVNEQAALDKGYPRTHQAEAA